MKQDKYFTLFLIPVTAAHTLAAQALLFRL
jgi:hypothetical protein